METWNGINMATVRNAVLVNRKTGFRSSVEALRQNTTGRTYFFDTPSRGAVIISGGWLNWKFISCNFYLLSLYFYNGILTESDLENADPEKAQQVLSEWISTMKIEGFLLTIAAASQQGGTLRVSAWHDFTKWFFQEGYQMVNEMLGDNELPLTIRVSGNTYTGALKPVTGFPGDNNYIAAFLGWFRSCLGEEILNAPLTLLVPASTQLGDQWEFSINMEAKYGGIRFPASLAMLLFP